MDFEHSLQNHFSLTQIKFTLKSLFAENKLDFSLGNHKQLNAFHALTHTLLCYPQAAIVLLDTLDSFFQ